MDRENKFWSGKSQGISFQTKSGHPAMGNVQEHNFTYTKGNLLDPFFTFI